MPNVVRILTASLLVLLPLCGVAESSFADADLVIPAIGRGSGAQDSEWYTTMWLYNPGAEAVDVTVTLLERRQSNPAPDRQTVTVAPGATVRFSEVVWELFGLESAAGALVLECPDPVVAGARVFNQPGDTVRESQGQLMSALPRRLAISTGSRRSIPGVIQPADGTFRSNFGLVETAGGTAQVTVTLLDGDGAEVAAGQLTIGPHGVLQRPLDSIAPTVDVSNGRLEVEVVGGDGAVMAYASAVANGLQSQDPTTLEMEFRAEAFGGGDAVTEVVAGPGLAGGGGGPQVSLSVAAGDGLEVSTDGVAIRPAGVRADHAAPGELVTGIEVDGESLHDLVVLEAGEGISIAADEGTVTLAASPATFERIEEPVTGAVVATSAGVWVLGGDRLDLPSGGTWRVGYRVVVEVENFGVGTVSDPVNVALVQDQTLIRGTLAVIGPQVGIGIANSAIRTAAGDAVIEVGGPVALAIAGRTSSSSLQLTVHPHDVDLSAGLGAPDAASYFYAEKIGD